MVTSGFFNSVNGDRKYSAEQMSAIFNGIINDGVFVNVGTAFAITADVGNKVLVGVGRAWIDSTWIYNDTPLEVELEDSDILTDRIDAVVLESDHSAPVRIGSIKVVKGVAQTNPVRPTMEHSFYVNQYPIAYILRPKNSTAITQANITYMVGTSELPFVTGILETLDIDALVAQWGAEWREWFDAIKDELSDDAAGNLQQQIDDLEEQAALLAPSVSIPSGSDLNDYIEAGTYFVRSMDVAQNVANSPITTSAYMFWVFEPYSKALNNTKRTQIAMTYNGVFYIRYRESSGKWMSWKRMDENWYGKFLPLTGGDIVGNVMVKNSYFDIDKGWLRVGDFTYTEGVGYIGARLAFKQRDNVTVDLLCTFNGSEWMPWIVFGPNSISINKPFNLMKGNRSYYHDVNDVYEGSIVGSESEGGLAFYGSDNGHIATFEKSLIKFNRNVTITGIGKFVHENDYNKFAIFDPIGTNHYWEKMIGKTGVGLYRYALREVYNNTGKIAYYIANGSYDASQLFSFHMEFYGSIGATAFEKDSSRLIKENIESLSEEDANKILDLRPVTFDFIESYGGAKGRIGLIAEEVVEVFPSVVTIPEEIDVENGKVPSIEYSELIAPLIKLTQMQQERIDEQDRKIEDLENRLAQVESLLNKI